MQPGQNIEPLIILREVCLVAAKANFLPHNKNLIRPSLEHNIKDKPRSAR